MFNRNLKERVKLLEYENQKLINKVNAIIAVLPKKPLTVRPNTNPIDGGDSYETLRKKYRNFTLKYEDEF